MKGFRATDQGLVAELETEERAVVARIAADVGLMLGGENFGMEIPTADVSEEDEIFAMLRGLEESLREPDDPAELRLLPSASYTDREVADEFRRLTEGDLRTLKVARLRDMWEQLSEDGPEWWVQRDRVGDSLGALTDIRLVLASRLGIDTDEDAERLHGELALAAHAVATEAAHDLSIDPERMWLGMLYDALGWLQGTLVECLTEDGDE
jgi:hypothetical protein